MKNIVLRLSYFFRFLLRTRWLLLLLLAYLGGGQVFFTLQAAEAPPGSKPRKLPSEIREGRGGRDRRMVPSRRSRRREEIPITAQDPRTGVRMGNRVKLKQKRAGDLIQSQGQPMVIPRVLSQATHRNVAIFIFLSRQRVHLKVGEEIAIDAPICSGKAAGMTPKGHFTILEKDPDHRSSVYGDFVDRSGQVVRAGVSLKIDSAPSGTTYVGAPMRWFMRLTWGGIGMHAGFLPGYPASHGCIRLPEQAAKIMYDCVKIGTLVVVAD